MVICAPYVAYRGEAISYHNQFGGALRAFLSFSVSLALPQVPCSASSGSPHTSAALRLFPHLRRWSPPPPSWSSSLSPLPSYLRRLLRMSPNERSRRGRRHC